MSQQKKALVEWLHSPITKKYYEFLKQHKEDLESKILTLSKTSFYGEGTGKRSEDEVSAHTRLIAVEMVINDWENLFEFEKYCEIHNLEIEEVGDKYEIQLPNGEKEERKNPLTIFISALYDNRIE